MMKKITKCKTCGAEISKTADICPKCGAKQKVKKIKFYFRLLIILSVITYLWYPWCNEYIGNKINGRINLSIGNENITYNQLFDEYEACKNVTEINAFNQKYKNVPISFTDEVVDINRKFYGGASMTFVKFKSDILLTITNNDEYAFNRINIGDKLYIEGVIKGAGHWSDLSTDDHLDNGCLCVSIQEATSDNIIVIN